MNSFLKITSLLVFVLILISTAFACSIAISGIRTEVRGNSDFYSSISAGKNQNIDVKINFYVDSYSGTDCPASIGAQAKIYKYNSRTGQWELHTSTSIQTHNLGVQAYQFQWDDAFNTGSNSDYTRYKITGVALKGTTELGSIDSYIDIQDNSCTGIRLNTGNITVDEGSTTTRTFTIENTTDQSFGVSSLNVYFTTALLRSIHADYDTTVPAHTTRTITLNIQAGYVSSNTTTTGTLAVTGSLSGAYCSDTAIGRKNFDLTVQDIGAIDYGNYGYYNDYDYSSGSADCKDISIQTRSISMDESSENKVAFSVKNNTTKRFEILDVKVTSNGLDLSNYYNEQYLFSGQTGDIILKAVAPAVTQNKTYDNTLKIQGRFQNGQSCSFSDIPAGTFTTTIANQGDSIITPNNCQNFSISAPSVFKIENYGSLSFTIMNGTNKKADIFIEGTVNASPTLITLPSNTSITRDLSITMLSSSGELYFRPVVEGCSLQTTKVSVVNTATGSIKQLTISTKTVKDANTGTVTLTIEINNPTTKVFDGTIEIQAPEGWITNDLAVSVAQGKNVYETKITPTANAKDGPVKVSFKSSGEEVTSTTSTSPSGTGNPSGLFTLGFNASSIGAVLLIILVIIIIVGLISGTSNPRHGTHQTWVEKKE